MGVKKTLIEIYAAIQERERKREKTREERKRDRIQFDYVFNGGPAPWNIRKD